VLHEDLYFPTTSSARWRYPSPSCLTPKTSRLGRSGTSCSPRARRPSSRIAVSTCRKLSLMFNQFVFFPSAFSCPWQ
jgi:hypothetical protein